VSILLQFQQDAGGPEDMAGVHERGPDAAVQRQRLAVFRFAAEIIQAVEGIQRGV
jgi:hypothetical protein